MTALRDFVADLMEREGALGERFGCATPAEAVQSQCLFAAALQSQKAGESVKVSWKSVRNENLAYEPDTNAFKCDACELDRPCLARLRPEVHASAYLS